ncbi:MAG: Lrp/AsnC family transcriptional regulator, partial [SAR116 cluster bacterium]|nr:Lrp/AsnC family transcriptional regulator [SAR116 cluster bacterium]
CVCRVPIDSHIKKMESSGVITGYRATRGAEEFRHNASAKILINVSANEEEDIISQMIVMPKIRRLYTPNGRWDLAAEIQTPTLEAFDVAVSRGRQIPGIPETDTSLLLSSRIG